jgi:hypothetical protein
MRFTHTTKEVALALRTSVSTLRRLRLAGVLRPGIHFCAIGAGEKAPNLLWSPEAVEETLVKRTRRLLGP